MYLDREGVGRRGREQGGRLLEEGLDRDFIILLHLTLNTYIPRG